MLVAEDSMNRPFIIPIFLPHVGCPHHCAFCNQTTITGVKHDIFTPEKLRFQINEFLKFQNRQGQSIQVAFYGGNFLGLNKDYITLLLDESTMLVKNGSIDSIRFSTRPDTIDQERLDILDNYPVSTVEIGVQSMDDGVLLMAKRGHTSLDTENAVARLKERNYEIGLQMMVGLPGDDETKSLTTAHRIADLFPDFVRIYPTVVLANSRLAIWYQKGKYKPWSLERCVTFVTKLYLLFKNKKIPVIRMGLQASENFEKGSVILAGPYHPAFGHLVYSEFFLDMATTIMETAKVSHKTITIKVHPRSISKMRGLKNKNIEALKRKFHIKSLEIIPDPSLAEDRLSVSL
jgi:histone acetyltransferase (RNA polymerase elongator complex component)